MSNTEVLMYDKDHSRKRLGANRDAIVGAYKGPLTIKPVGRAKKFGRESHIGSLVTDVALETDAFPYAGVVLHAGADHFDIALTNVVDALEYTEQSYDRLLVLHVGKKPIDLPEGVRTTQIKTGNGYLNGKDTQEVARHLQDMATKYCN